MGVGGAVAEKPQTRPQYATAQRTQPEPTASIPSQPVELKAASQEATNTATETLTSILHLKRVIRFAVIGLILVALVAVAAPVVKLARAQLNRMAAVAATAPAPPQKATVANSQPSASQSLNQSQESPAVVTSPVEAKGDADSVNAAAIAQAALEAQRQQDQEKADAEARKRKEAEAAKQQADMEAQRRQEQERQQAALEQKRQERENMIAQLKSTLTTQTALLAKFKADCMARLDNNATNKLLKLTASSRRALSKTNDEFREQIAKNAKIQEDSLDNAKKDTEAISANPQLDPKTTSDSLTSYIADIKSQQARVTALMAELDTAISNAPQRKPIFNFQVK